MVRKIYVYVKEIIEIQRTNIMPVPVENELIKIKVLKRKKEKRETPILEILRKIFN